ncbi:RraA family protein [Candidatus Latescibacterota bacterium]
MKFRNFAVSFGFIIFVSCIMLAATLNAQPTSLSREELIQYTPFWKGERFPNGRPKVPDEIVDRMKYVSITEAWGTVRSPDENLQDEGAPGRRAAAGYDNQYEGKWKMMHDDVTICGRALTSHFMPFRPDVNSAINEQGKKDKRGSGQFVWGVDQLQKGDVYVVNVCEAILDASPVGDNVGTAIWSQSGNGAIIYGTVRDLEGNQGIEGFNLFVRDFRPQSNSSNMIMGVNCPIQIGYVTVMPGDIVLAKRTGVVFIPPHYAEMVVNRSERTRLRDTFAHIGVLEGRFTANQADGGYTPEMNKEFNQWLKDNMNTMGRFFEDPNEAPPRKVIEAYIKERESGQAR